LDIVGDVHGCLEELLELMAALGYRVQRRAADSSALSRTGNGLRPCPGNPSQIPQAISGKRTACAANWKSLTGS
jgi:hypothetical protein